MCHEEVEDSQVLRCAGLGGPKGSGPWTSRRQFAAGVDRPHDLGAEITMMMMAEEPKAPVARLVQRPVGFPATLQRSAPAAESP